MNAVLFLIVFLVAWVFFEWLEGGAPPSALVGHGFTWVDWMFLVAISSIGGPTLVIVFARVINSLHRRDKKTRNIHGAGWTREPEIVRNGIAIVSCDSDRLVLRLPGQHSFLNGNLTACRQGDRIIIERADRKSLVQVLNEMTPLSADDDLPDVRKGLPPLKKVDL